MAWHKEFQVTVYVDGDEGTIKCDSPELFEFFSERVEIAPNGINGHEFPMAIYDSAAGLKTVYWVYANKATERTDR